MEQIKTRFRIILDTESSLVDVVNIASKLPDNISVVIKDNHGMCVNARSIIGMMYAMTFKELWLESNSEVYSQFNKFAAE